MPERPDSVSSVPVHHVVPREWKGTRAALGMGKYSGDLASPGRLNRMNMLRGMGTTTNVTWTDSQLIQPPTLPTSSSTVNKTPMLATGLAVLPSTAPTPTSSEMIVRSRPLEQANQSDPRSSTLNASLLPTSAVVSSMPGATVAIQANANKSNDTYYGSKVVSSTIVPVTDSGAKVDTEALPGMNQDDPSLKDAPRVTPLATPNSGEAPISPPAVTVDRPMPGKNQPQPTMGGPMPPWSVTMDVTSTSTLTSTTSLADQAQASVKSATFTTSSQAPPSTFAILSATSPTSDPMSSASTTPAISSVLALSSSTTFITVTRSEQGKEQVSATRTSNLAPQAITAAQSLSLLFSSTTGLSSFATLTATPPPVSTAVSAQQQGRLTPLARTLFIIFGVLGAITILIAFGVVLMMKSNRSRVARRNEKSRENSFDPRTRDDFGVTTQISANGSVNENPFLTENEKAIVTRATSPDGEQDPELANPNSRFADAINSFVEKSRRLTYKISP